MPVHEGGPAPNHYFDAKFEIEAAKILPGEYYATARDMMLVTTLGSCVSACLRDPVSQVGGMNHFLLPDEADPGNPISRSARYGAYAMEMLLNQLLKLGAARDRIEAKVFGGGTVMSVLAQANVGERNSDFVLDYLGTERIRIVAHDLRGYHPRKVYFFPASGRVLVKRLRQYHNDTLIRREEAYAGHLKRADLAGEVELFNESATQAT